MVDEPTSGPRAALRALAARLPPPRWGLLAVLAYFVACALLVTYVQASTWDMRAHAQDPVDSTWRLELAWRAWHGEWSYVDFHYARGPAWQAVGAVAYALAGGDPAWTLSLLYLGFHLCTLGLLFALAWRRIEPRWGAVGAFAGAALLSNAAGIATLRGFLPLAVIFTYPARDSHAAHPWRSAWWSAGWAVLATLVSFDRLYAIAFCVAAMAGYEVLVRLRRREPARDALLRLARFLVAFAACVAGVSVLGLIVGADPIAVVQGQRHLAGAYASHMATEWRVAVPPANVLALFTVCAAYLAVPLIRPERPGSRIDEVWLAGALPAVSFGIIRADEGHMILAMIPALVVLSLLAGGAGPEMSTLRRLVAGVLACVAVVGWFGAYPSNLAGNPRVFAETLEVLSGHKRADPGYQTEHGAAVAWARSQTAPGECIGTSANMTLAHPAADRRGPTELATRWSHEMKLALADAIEEAGCPRFLYSAMTYDYPGDAWILGPDFVRIARLYEPERRLGVGLIGLRRRATPLPLERRRLPIEASEPRIAIPGEVRVRLGEPVVGTDILDVQLQLDVEAWRAFAGGAPLVEWRLERDGEPVADWAHLYQAGLNAPSRVQVSADPEATEWYWIIGAPPTREVSADTLAFRVSPRGRASPSGVSLRVDSVERLRLHPPAPEPPSTCDGDADLLERVRQGAAYARYVSPHPGRFHFDLEPSPPNHKLAEVVFEVTPCADTCLLGAAAVRAAPEESDGVDLEVHVLDLPVRTLVHEVHVPAGGEELPFEVSLGAWAGRPVLLRIGTLPSAVWANDYAKIVRPRLATCRARAELATDLDAGVSVPSGSAIEDGSNVRLGPVGAQLRMPMTAVRDTCFSTGVELDRDEAALFFAVRVRDGGVEHVVYAGEVSGSEGEVRIDGISLFDFTGREVELVLDARPLTTDASAVLIRPRVHRCGEDAP